MLILIRNCFSPTLMVRAMFHVSSATKTSEMASDPFLVAAKGFPERVLLWNDTEAEQKQVKQVGISACGATSVLNVLVRKKKKKNFELNFIIPDHLICM